MDEKNENKFITEERVLEGVMDERDSEFIEQARKIAEHEKLIAEKERAIIEARIRIIEARELAASRDAELRALTEERLYAEERAFVQEREFAEARTREELRETADRRAIEEHQKNVAMSRQAYQYNTNEANKLASIQGVLPQADDDSTENDTSGNIIDASGNKMKNTYKKFTYKEVEDKIYDNYFNERTGWSSSLDIIGTYLRGQKLIYMESKSYCENKLNRLMMPSIFLSTSATVLSAIVKEWYWGAYLIAGVNGVIAFLLAVVNYLKLDAASEAHKITAHQYDKLQTKIEFLSGQALLFDNTKREDN